MTAILFALAVNVALSVADYALKRLSPRYREWHARAVERCFYFGYAKMLKLRRRRLQSMKGEL